MVVAALALVSDGSQHTPVFQVESRVVNLTVTVADKRGKYLPNLKADDFSVYEDGNRRPVALFSTEDLHLDLVIIMDTSASMRVLLPKVRLSAKMLVGTLRPDDHVEVMTFASGVYRACPFTNDHDVIGRALDASAPEDDESHIYRALADAFRELRAHDIERDRRRAVVLFTDGADTDRLAADEEWLLREASLADATVYIIMAPAPSDVEWAFPDPRDPFRKVARESGGSVFPLHTPYALQAAFVTISRELRTQYRLGYEPTDRTDGGWRNILVNVRGDTVVRHKLRYFSPKARPSWAVQGNARP
jgi:Ca-activated chloride channel family protein